MINLLNCNIIPGVGLGDIKLYSKLEDVKVYLKENGIDYNMNVWPNKGCTPEVPWILLIVANSITFFFANDKLWKITLENSFKGMLPNGIALGTSLETALNNADLVYDDFEEIYKSTDGYWFDINLSDNSIFSISLVIKEAFNDEEFFKYQW